MRTLLTLVLSLALLAGPRLDAAVNLLGASNARVDFGDIDAISATQHLSVAITVRLTAASATGDMLVHQWSPSGSAESTFLIDVIDTDEIRYITHNGVSAATCYYGFKTTGLNLANGSTYRILGRMADFASGSRTLDIWINGVSQTVSNTNTPGICPGNLSASTQPVVVGYNAARPTDNLDADYSEFAIWSVKVPDWVAVGYGKGMSPAMYRTGGILYAPLINTNTDGLRDVWGGILGTNTSGTSAAHPSMYYPTGGQ